MSPLRRPISSPSSRLGVAAAPSPLVVGRGSRVPHGLPRCPVNSSLSQFSSRSVVTQGGRTRLGPTERAQECSGHDGRRLGPEHGRAEADGRGPGAISPRRPTPPRGPRPRPGRSRRRGRAPPGSASAAGPSHGGELAEVGTTPVTSGSHGRRHWAAASRATRRSRSTARSARSPSHRTTERAVRSGTIRSTPSSVSFWTTHSGRSPLTGAKATVSSGRGRGRLTVTGPSGTERAPRRSARRASAARRRAPPGTATHRPAPSAATTASPARRRQHVEQVVDVGGVEPRARSGRRRRPWPRRPTRRRVGARMAPRTAPGTSAQRGPQLGEEALAVRGPRRAPRRGPRPDDGSSSRWRSSRSVGVSTCTWTKRSPRPRPRSWGTPRPFRCDDGPGLGTRGDGEVALVVEGVEADAAPEGGHGHGHVHGGVQIVAVPLEDRVGLAPSGGRRGRRWGHPGSRPGRDRPVAGSNRRRRRPGPPR